MIYSTITSVSTQNWKQFKTFSLFKNLKYSEIISFLWILGFLL